MTDVKIVCENRDRSINKVEELISDGYKIAGYSTVGDEKMVYTDHCVLMLKE